MSDRSSSSASMPIRDAYRSRQTGHQTADDYFKTAFMGPPNGADAHRPPPSGRALSAQSRSRPITFEVPGLQGPDDDLHEPALWGEFQEKQQSAEEQAFERETREGRDPDPSLCRTCRRLGVVGRDNLSDDEGLAFYPFGSWAQLLCRRACAFCRLVVGLLSAGRGELHPQLAMIDREIQGTRLYPVRLRTGEWVVNVQFGERPVGSIRAVREDNWREVVRQQKDIKPESLSNGTSPVEKWRAPLFGRAFSTRRLKAWLKECCESHDEICKPAYAGLKGLKDVDVYLIDMKNKKLIEATTKSEYLALSYVWGQKGKFHTTASNLESRLKANGLRTSEKNMPKTIADAATLVENLGYQYLWVDALCIVQNDKEQKQYSIKNMDMIFARAYATIVALYGDNSDAGLPGIRFGRRQFQQVEHTAHLSLIATPPPLNYILDLSTWTTRAWTFQERLLSRRCIYFSQDYVYFQCLTNIDAEVEYNMPLHQDQQLEEQPSLQKYTSISRLVANRDGAKRPNDWNFLLYKWLVEAYTARKATFTSDVLDALAGVVAALQGRFKGTIISGIPSSVLDLALLWTHAEPPSPRRPAKAKHKDVSEDFPSWSWSGWMGPVLYTIGLDSRVRYPTVQIESFRIQHSGMTYEVTGRGLTSRSDGTKIANNESQEFWRQSVSEPDFGPNVLQFKAWAVSAFEFGVESAPFTFLSSPEQRIVQGRQGLVRIFDSEGNHCGVMFATGGKSETLDGRKDFVMISTFSVDERHGEPTYQLYGADGTIELYDHKVFGWGNRKLLVNALLIEWHDLVAVRVTVAHIISLAWKRAQSEVKHIRLR